MVRRRPTRPPALPLVLGITDGILNALTLATGAVLHGGGGQLGAGLSVRVGIASCVTAAFTMFVADYAERRVGLVRASREINLAEPGALASTRLGAIVVRESALTAVVAATASLVGASGPLLLGTVLPGPSWLALVLSVVMLGLLGGVIATMFHGRRSTWVVAMLVAGTLVLLLGAVLDIA